MQNFLFCIMVLTIAWCATILTNFWNELSLIRAEQAVLRSMFTTKVDRFNHVSWRHEYAEPLREELERLEAEAGVK